MDEKAVAKSRAIRQTGTNERIGAVNFKHFLETLYDAKAWGYAVGISMLRSTYTC